MLGNKKINFLLLGVLSLILLTSPLFADGEFVPYIPKDGTKVKHSNKAFRPDPVYKDLEYSPEAQLNIYGGKKAYRNPRPLLELGRPLYPIGEFPATGVWDGDGWPTTDQFLSTFFFGDKNPAMFHLMVFGDFKTAIAYNTNGDNEQGVIAWQLNLNIDIQLTSTERIHIFMQPLQQGGDFTRWDFGGENHNFESRLDFNVENLFFEGDLGALVTGWTGNESGFDMPIAFGLINLLFHNGVWFNEAFTGAAFTIPALNVPALDISNMDITFFAGFDRIDTNAINADEDADIFGVNLFIESMRGYWEIGYGYTRDSSEDGINDSGNFADYHNIIVSFSKRYGGILSNSIRVIWNFGQDEDTDTADGVLILIENSLITSLPSTLVPYFNFFAGFDRPQSLANNNGNLFQTGINFETDGLTGFPKLDDTGQDTFGGAIGIEYLFNLDKQIVLEFATVQELEGAERAANFEGEQYAFQLRFQLPVNWGTTWNATIFRIDAMYAILPEQEDLHGIRLEIRQKF